MIHFFSFKLHFWPPEFHSTYCRLRQSFLLEKKAVAEVWRPRCHFARNRQFGTGSGGEVSGQWRMKKMGKRNGSEREKNEIWQRGTQDDG